MSETFDPYHKWLGIPSDEQPPNHYRILGVPLFTSDGDVITNAADRQMSHVRTFQSGKNAKLTQQILNEISAAKVCLLESAERVAYDKSLRESINEAKKPARIAKLVDDEKPPAMPTESVVPANKAPVRVADPLPTSKRPSLVLIGVSGVTLLSLVAGIGLYVAGVFGYGDAPPVEDGDSQQPGMVQVVDGAKLLEGADEGDTTSKQDPIDSNAIDRGGSDATRVASKDPMDNGSSTTGGSDPPEPPANDLENTQQTPDNSPVSTGAKTLKFTAPDKTDGVELFRWSDGTFDMATADSHAIVRATSQYVYFRIDDDTLFELPNDTKQLVTIRLRLWDYKPGSFTLHYDGHQVTDVESSQDTTWVEALTYEMKGTGKWKTVEFHIRRARFANRQQERGDFRICAWGDYRIALQSVEVEHRQREVYTLEEPVDLLKTVDLAKHQYWGTWSYDGKSLVSPSDPSPVRVQIPFEVPDEYILTVDVERVDGRNMLAIGLPVQGGQSIVSLDAASGNGLVSCLQTVDNTAWHSNENVTRRFMDLFVNGERTTITCIVRGSGVEVRKDGKPIIEFEGDLRRLDAGRVWDVPDRSAFILGAWHSVFRITRIEIAPLSESAGVETPGTVVKRVDGAAMKLEGLGQSDRSGMWLWTNDSTAIVEFDCSATGDYRLRMAAFAAQAGPDPARMSIKVDSAVIKSFDVKATRELPGMYVARTKMQRGRRQIAITFDNDYMRDNEDRNLYLSHLEIELVGDRSAQPSDRVVRRPVPTRELRAAALTEIKGLFEYEYKNARKPDELLALAKKMHELGGTLKSDPVVRFAALSEAWRLATEAGDVELSISGVDQLAEEYEIDQWDLRGKTLTAVLRNAKSPEGKTAAARVALRLTEEAAAADRYEQAGEFAKSALAATSRGRDDETRQLRTSASTWVRNVKSLAEQFESVQVAIETLMSDADDGAANLDIGRFLCFAKGDWERGLKHLAKSDKAKFVAAATSEEKDPEDASGRLAVGDAWWDLTDDLTVLEKKAVIARACHWYRRSLAVGLSGLQQKRIEKRLQDHDKAFHKFDADLVGHWTFDEDTKTSIRDSAGKQHGRVVGSVDWNRNGRIGTALHLKGNGYLTFADRDFGDQFTIVLWAKLDSSERVHCLVSNRQGGHLVPGFTLRANDNNDPTRRLSFDNANGTAKNWLHRSGVIQFGQWHHIAVAVSRTNGVGVLYLDGKPLMNPTAIRPDFKTDGPWRVGKYVYGSARGLLDDLRIYKRVLKAEEIAVLSRM
jgi:hypothetical protein